MRLTLTYQGPLPPTQRGVGKVKTNLREAFHPQIEAQLRPRVDPKTVSAMSTGVEQRTFVSPVHSALRTAAELDILMLVPRTDRPTGDTDNRTKTLIDGLTRPANSEQLGPPPSAVSGADPTFCLMDDDALVRRLSVEVRPWFEPSAQPRDAMVIVTAMLVLGDNADLSSPTANLFLVL